MNKRRIQDQAKPPEGYMKGAELAHEMVGLFKIFGPGRPLFAMPPPDVALIGSIADVGKKLARNDAARELVELLMAETKRRQLNDYPTVMMLRVALKLHDLPVVAVPLPDLMKDLGIKVPRGRQ